jgi:hypothetical protein
MKICGLSVSIFFVLITVKNYLNSLSCFSGEDQTSFAENTPDKQKAKAKPVQFGLFSGALLQPTHPG